MGAFRRHRTQVRPVVALALLLLLSPLSLGAASPDDAGLGVDAGNTRDAASVLPGTGYYKANLTGGDVDWYSLRIAPAPVCSTSTLTRGPASRVSMFVGDRGVHTLSNGVDQASVSLAFASGAAVLTRHETASTPGAYDFALALHNIPSKSAGDALSGKDAGSALSSALAVKPGCIGGRLMSVDTLVDTADVYAIPLKAGEEFSYSFASADPAAGLRLSLLDASGVEVSSALLTEGLARFAPSVDGIYYMMVSSSNSGVRDAGYIIGATSGPPDPGNPCRPQC